MIETREEAIANDLKDTERLDWLEQRHGLINTSDSGPHVCIDDGRDGYYHAYGGTYRAALDKAMLEYVAFVPPPAYEPSLDYYAEELRKARLAYETALLRKISTAALNGKSEGK